MRMLSVVLTTLCVSSEPLHSETYDVDVWADNGFEMRVNGTQVAEDSIPITTGRSFNAENFSFEAEPPLVIGLVAKDFKQNDTGPDISAPPVNKWGMVA